MTSNSPRLLIVDQSLRDMAGHHYEYDVALFRAAAAAGVPTVIGAHSAVQSLELLGGSVRPWFENAWYQTQGVQPAGVVPPSRSFFSRVRRRLARLMGFTAVGPKPAATGAEPRSGFGDDVLRLVRAEGFGSIDHLLVHTFSIPELDSLIELARTQAGLPLIHIVFRRDAEEPSVADGPTGGIRAALTGLMSSPAARATLRLYADTEDLARQYADLVRGLDVAVIPIPHCLPPRAAGPAARKPGPLRIIYLGDARDEKGFYRLADLVDALRDRLFPLGRARFVLQNNISVAGDSAVQADARKRLAAYPTAEVELITEQLPITAFHELLHDADIVLLPYDAAAYARRSSGILVQALAAGRVVVVPSQTWMARQVDPAASVHFSDTTSLPDAVAAAVEHWPALSRRAEDGAASWRAQHDPALFIAQIMRARV